MAGSNPCWEGRDYLGWWVKNHWFHLAKTELENFKNWTQNQIIGSLCLEPELEFLKIK
jgi:hypothetical protein